MPPKRPTPLSDELFAHPMLLGSTRFGAPMPVKNTFIDVPLGVTPAGGHQEHLMLTAPAKMNKSLALPGYAAATMHPSAAVPIGTLQTPTGGFCVIPPTPSPQHAWDSRRDTSRGLLPSTAAAPRAAEVGQLWTRSICAPGGQAGAAHPYGAPPQEGTAAGGWPAFSQSPFTYALLPDATEPFRGALAGPSFPQLFGLGGAQAAASGGQDAGSTTLRRGTSVDSGEEEDEEEEEKEEEEAPGASVQVVDAPRPPTGAPHPSLGSEGHASGACKRCCFFPRGRCANGYDCEFCHYEHEKRKRKNKAKGTAGMAGGACLALRVSAAAPTTAAPLRGAPAPQPQAAVQLGQLGVHPCPGRMPEAPMMSMLQPALSVRPADTPAMYAGPVIMHACQPQHLAAGGTPEGWSAMALAGAPASALAPRLSGECTGYCWQGQQHAAFHVVQLPPAMSQQAAMPERYAGAPAHIRAPFVEAATPPPPPWSPRVNLGVGLSVPPPPPALPGMQCYGGRGNY